MKKTILAASAAVLLSAGSAAAQGWERQGTAYGPYGGKATIDRHCDGYSCETRRTYTGPGGRTWTQRGYAERDGQGGWRHQGKVTGPHGGTTTYGGSGRCSGGACSWSGGGTGPHGGSWSRHGSFQRH